MRIPYSAARHHPRIRASDDEAVVPDRIECPYLHSAGAFALGALPWHESETYAGHAERCRICTAELDSMRPLVRLLAKVTPI